MFFCGFFSSTGSSRTIWLINNGWFTLTGLADENESVRDAALGAGHVLVEHYATT